MKTREEQERDRCEREMEGTDSPADKLLCLIGWADWEIERQYLTQGGQMYVATDCAIDAALEEMEQKGKEAENETTQSA